MYGGCLSSCCIWCVACVVFDVLPWCVIVVAVTEHMNNSAWRRQMLPRRRQCESKLGNTNAFQYFRKTFFQYFQQKNSFFNISEIFSLLLKPCLLLMKKLLSMFFQYLLNIEKNDRNRDLKTQKYCITKKDMCQHAWYLLHNIRPRPSCYWSRLWYQIEIISPKTGNSFTIF